MAGIENGVPRILIQQGIHSGDVGTGDFHIEEQVVRNRKCVDEQIVQRHLVGQISLTGIHVVNRRDINQEEVDEKIVEVENFCQHCILKGVLNPQYKLSFEAVDPICVVTGAGFDGFIECIGEFLPQDDEQISADMQVVSMFLNFRIDTIHGDPAVCMVSSEVPTQ